MMKNIFGVESNKISRIFSQNSRYEKIGRFDFDCEGFTAFVGVTWLKITDLRISKILEK